MPCVARLFEHARIVATITSGAARIFRIVGVAVLALRGVVAIEGIHGGIVFALAVFPDLLVLIGQWLVCRMVMGGIGRRLCSVVSRCLRLDGGAEQQGSREGGNGQGFHGVSLWAGGYRIRPVVPR